MRNMEIFYGIKINTAIRVRMDRCKQHCKNTSGRSLFQLPARMGVCLALPERRQRLQYLYRERLAEALRPMATIAHELTHIWQYQNWDDKAVTEAYGAHNRLEVYEGMAKWAEIQYLLYLNETAYGNANRSARCSGRTSMDAGSFST